MSIFPFLFYVFPTTYHLKPTRPQRLSVAMAGVATFFVVAPILNFGRMIL